MFEAEDAAVALGSGGLAEKGELAVGDGEAAAAHDGALVPLDHGDFLAPFAAAEVAEDVGHLDVERVGAGLSHWTV